MTTFAADSSVAVAATIHVHEFHSIALPVVLDRRPILAGHAVFETLSVLTRLVGTRLSPSLAASTLSANFGEPCWLTAKGSRRVFGLVGERGLAGGAIFDALVAQAALDHDRVLLSLDRRAEATYRSIGVRFEILSVR